MNRRQKTHPRPPTGPGYKCGPVLTVPPSKDDPNPSKMVDVVPAGNFLILHPLPSTDEPDPSTMIDVVPGGTDSVLRPLVAEEVARGGSHPSPSREAFLQELDCLDEGRADTLPADRWAHVLPDPSVWPALTTFLIRTGREHDNGTVESLLIFGRGPLADYWLSTESKALRRIALDWLGVNWRHEWDRLSDETKRTITEELADRLARAEGASR